MKFYNVNLSNYATKSRIAIYDKGLKLEIVNLTLADLHSPEYLKINPLGKIPCLEADGLVVPESEVINEYLEDKFPEKPLLPESPEARARVRLLTRFHDLYLEPPLRALFPQMNSKTRDETLVNEKLTEANRRLDELDKLLGESGFSAGSEFTLADCALAPTMLFANVMLPQFGAKPALEARPRLASWWNYVQTRPSVKKGLAEMHGAFAEMQQASVAAQHH